MFPAECNEEIYDKKLFAIIQVFKKWYPRLAKTSIEDFINVITEYKNLEYFMSTKDLNRRKAQWVKFFTEFNF